MADAPKYGDGIKFQDERFAEYTYTAEASGHLPYSLNVSGRTYTEADFVPIRLINQYSDHSSFDFIMYSDWDGANFQLNDSVRFYSGSNCIFRGKILNVSPYGSDSQGIIYSCLSSSLIIKQKPFTRSGTRSFASASGTVIYNADIGEVDYILSLSDMTCGEIIQDILDNSVSDIGSTFTYLPAELSGMDIIPPRIEFAGKTIQEAIEYILEFQPNFKWWFESHNQILHFERVSKNYLTERAITTSGHDITNLKVRKDILNCVSRVIIEGRHEVENVGKFSRLNSPSSAVGNHSIADFILQSDWLESLESTYTDTLSQDDPAKLNYGSVYSLYSLPTGQLPLQGSTITPSGYNVWVYNTNIGAGGNWHDLSASINMATGEVRVSGNQYNSISETVNTPRDILIRYAYQSKTPMVVDSGYSGTAYSTYGWDKTWYFVDPEYKKQDVYGYINSIDGLNVIDYTSSFSEEMVGKTLNGKEITAVSGSQITLASVAGLSAGDNYYIPFRDDTTSERGMKKIASAILEVLGDINYQTQFEVLELDHTEWILGTKINIDSTSDSDLSSMNAPVERIEFNFQKGSTIISASSGVYMDQLLDYEELKRRFFTDRSKNDAFKNIRVASNNASSSNTGSSASSSGVGTTIAEHDHSSDLTGGAILLPEQCLVSQRLQSATLTVLAKQTYLTTTDISSSSYATNPSELFIDMANTKIILPTVYNVYVGATSVKPISYDYLYAHWMP